MSNEPDLRVTRSVELLARLREMVSQFANSEEKLTREIATRRVAMNRKFRDAMERVELRLSAQTIEVETKSQEEEQRVTAIYEDRRARIQRAYTTGIRSLPKRAQSEKERWMGDLQLRKFRAERKLAAEREAIAGSVARCAGRIGEQDTVLAELERRTRKGFRGYRAFLKLLDRPAPEVSANGSERDELLAAMRSKLLLVDERLAAYRQFGVARSFGEMPLVVVIPLIAVIGCVAAVILGTAIGVSAAAILLVAVLGIHRLGGGQSSGAAGAVAEALSEAHVARAKASVAAQSRADEDRASVEEEYKTTCAAIQKQWDRADEVESEFEKAARDKIEAQWPRVAAKNGERVRPILKRIETERSTRLHEIRGDVAARKVEFTTAFERETAALAADEMARWTALEQEWQREIGPLHATIAGMNAVMDERFPKWNPRMVEDWLPATEFAPVVKFAALDLDFAKRGDAAPKDPRLALPGGPHVSIPLALRFPEQGSLLFETNESADATVIGTFDNIILRLLATTPPGKLSFTIIDPVGLGQNFGGLMHLSDYEESLINRRIWTQRDQIDERLAELSEHIEKVIQMYLRNEYATITEYNAQAGSVAEKYHFLVVADFPANFSESAAKRLQSIAISGPRCGIYTLIHWDQRATLPDGVSADELRRNSVCIRRERGEFALSKVQIESGAALVFDSPPDPDLAVALVHRIGKGSIDSNRVEVPFAQITPPADEYWKGDTTHELRVAIGRTGATKQQILAIGKGTRQHALFAGKTGSGKSTLFHVIITNLALSCSPEQVEFYLIDFKKGVEFKCYASKRLPHARVVAIESDREFALSVLQRVDAELKRRGDMFRKLGVQDVAGYKKAGGGEPMPRSLLLIDEFQEFFVEDDTIAQTASLLFDRIVRQGRAFGIHVLLGSQSLGGAYSLARATLGQMVIRVALQCNEADAYLIMDDSNSAPRLLSRPGEGIYNDAGGALEGNSPFQVVWLPDDERDAWLDKVCDVAGQQGRRFPSPVVFEGNAPSDIRENDLLQTALDAPPIAVPTVARCWLGAPNSIKGPTEAAFHRQSGNHLLIVGQRDEAAISMVGVSMISLAAQYPVGGARFIVLNSANAGSPEAEFIDGIVGAIRHSITVVRGQDVTEAMNEIAAELKARGSGGDEGAGAPPVFLFIHGLHRFKKLRHEDDFSFSSDATANPGTQLNDLICEGASLGMHLIATVDTFNNVNRGMSRKALSEFEMRVVFQMSANDSASLIDSPKASGLGLHRALFYNEQEGTLETFRPYAIPDVEWIGEVAAKLARSPA